MAYGHCARVPGPGLNCAEIHVDLTKGIVYQTID